MFNWAKIGGLMFLRMLIAKIGTSTRKDIISSVASSIIAVAFYALAGLLLSLFTTGAALWLAYTALVSHYGFEPLSAIAILVAGLVTALVAIVMVILSYIKGLKQKIAEARKPHSAVARVQSSLDSVVTQFSTVTDAFLDGLMENHGYHPSPQPRRANL